MSKKKLVKDITAREEDFAKWYSDICLKAELMAYSNIQGFIIYLPRGFMVWENIQNYLNDKFYKTGHKNVYFPLLIPESMFQKEKDHIEGFAPEAAMVTTSGVEPFSERLIIRPTSEILFADYFKDKIMSYRDLPLLFNQWCSVVRWEKTTRPFLRGKEFLWQEGHTVHETKKEAEEETLRMLKIYENLGTELLAIPFITGIKTENEKFAGAVKTYSIEALMPDGKALQSGTSHYLGQNFAKAFDIKFLNKENKQTYAHQTSWGVSTRLIGAVIMVHGDSDGIIMPPRVAPEQVVIIPLTEKQLEVAKKIDKQLKEQNIRSQIDERFDKTNGFKFSDWEMKGVPLRITIGERELKNDNVEIFKRNTREKSLLKLDKVSDKIPELLDTIHNEMLEKAKEYLKKNTREVKTYKDFKKEIKKGGYVILDSSASAEEIIKSETGATARVILNKKPTLKKCPITSKKVDYKVLYAKAY